MIKEQLNLLFFPHDQEKDHFKSLDGLRGFAVLLVLLSHSSLAGLQLFGTLDFSKAGRTGVYLFFILSAYLLDSQIAHKLYHKQANQLYWKNYFLRRFTRIYPLFALALIAYYLSNEMGYTTAINESSDIPRHLLLQRGKSIFWSIPVEFIYYFISPAIIFLCYKVFKLRITGVIFSFSLIMISIAIANEHGIFSHTSSFKFLIIFLFGALAAISEIAHKLWFANKKVLLEVLGGLSLFILIFITPAFLKLFTDYTIDTFRPRHHFLFGATGMLVLLACKYGSGFIRKIFEIKILRFLGTISFSLYLFHVLTLRAVTLFFKLEGNLGLILFFVVSIVLSSFTYILIERPLMKFRIKNSGLTTKA